MDLLSVYETIYTVLFVLAGVFFAAAVLVFFRFRVAQAVENLFGVKMPGKRKTSPTPTKPVELPEIKALKHSGRAAKSASKQPAYEGTVTLSVEPAPQTASERGSKTVWFDDRATSCLETDDSPSTAELGGTTGGLEETDARNLSADIEAAKRKIGFRPDVTILKFSSGERI